MVIVCGPPPATSDRSTRNASSSHSIVAVPSTSLPGGSTNQASDIVTAQRPTIPSSFANSSFLMPLSLPPPRPGHPPPPCKEGVDELLIESRGPQDAEDRRTLMAAVHAGDVPADLAYDFAGKDEALMWLPDAVAGIVGEAERRKDDRWIKELQDAAAVFDVHRIYAHEPRLPS
jgi:hypothetical protein